MPPTAAAPAAPAGAAPVTAPPASKSTAPDLSKLPTERPVEDWLGDAGAELESLDEDRKPARPAPKPEDRTDNQELDDLGEKGDTRGTERHLQKPEDKKADEQKPGDQKPEGTTEPDPARMGPRDLRKAFEGSQKKIKEELQPTIAKLEARVKELEATGPKEDPQQVERFKQIEARNKELEQEITFVNYEKSEEYQSKYWKPYVQAWDNARRDLKELTVEAKDATGNYVERAATEDDVMLLASLPLGEARKRCNAMFGDSADDVMFHVREIRKLSDAQQNALAEAKKNAGTRAQQMMKQSEEMTGLQRRVWTEANSQLAAKFPRWFAPVEGDAKGNELLRAGEALTKYLFNGGKLEPEDIKLLPKSFQTELETKGHLSPENQVRLHALIRSKAMNHDRLAYQNNQLRKELAEAKKALSQYESSEPPVGGSRRRQGAAALGDETDAFAEIDELDRRGR